MSNIFDEYLIKDHSQEERQVCGTNGAGKTPQGPGKQRSQENAS
jgi:hypothetical protein